MTLGFLVLNYNPWSSFNIEILISQIKRQQRNDKGRSNAFILANFNFS